MEFIIIAASGMLAAVISSFFNVLVNEESWRNALWRRSHADDSKRPLNWYEMVPVISSGYIWFRKSFLTQSSIKSGKKNILKEDQIDIRYFLTEFYGFIWGLGLGYYTVIEFSTGIISVWQLVIVFLLAYALLYSSIYDIWHFQIDVLFISILIAIIGLLNWFVFFPSPIQISSSQELLVRVGTAVFAVLSVLLLIIISRGKGLGVGDIWLVALIFIFHSPLLGLGAMLVTIYTAAFIGLVAAGLLRKFRGLIIPLAPFLNLGWLAAVIFSDQLLSVLGFIGYI